MPQPDSIYLFRIIHIENLDHILSKGLWKRTAQEVNPDYIAIGDSSIIRDRKELNACDEKPLSDFIPFYFSAKSPMLYVIQKGYNHVTKRAPSEIIYLITTFDEVKQAGRAWCFSDGNARDLSSKFYQEEGDFDKLDWEVIRSQDWANREEDMDRKRRKQAEFLVEEHLPASCLTHIIVYDDKSLSFVEALVKQHGLTIQVAKSPKHYY